MKLQSEDDGIGNNTGLDDDADTMPDDFELSHGMDPLVDDRLTDANGDNTLNIDEYHSYIASWLIPILFYRTR